MSWKRRACLSSLRISNNLHQDMQHTIDWTQHIQRSRVLLIDLRTIGLNNHRLRHPLLRFSSCVVRCFARTTSEQRSKEPSFWNIPVKYIEYKYFRLSNDLYSAIIPLCVLPRLTWHSSVLERKPLRRGQCWKWHSQVEALFAILLYHSNQNFPRYLDS